MFSFPNFEPAYCSMSHSNCCFLTCIQVSQEGGKVVWCSHLFKNFPQFAVIHTVSILVTLQPVIFFNGFQFWNSFRFVDKLHNFYIALTQFLPWYICQNQETSSNTLLLTKWSEVKSLSHVWLFATPWAIALLHPWNFPGKSTGMGCHFFFQGILLTQGLNPGLLHCRQMLYCLSHQGSPILLLNKLHPLLICHQFPPPLPPPNPIQDTTLYLVIMPA